MSPRRYFRGAGCIVARIVAFGSLAMLLANVALTIAGIYR